MVYVLKTNLPYVSRVKVRVRVGVGIKVRVGIKVMFSPGMYLNVVKGFGSSNGCSSTRSSYTRQTFP